MAVALVMPALLPGGCDPNRAIALPGDPEEKAATCYVAQRLEAARANQGRRYTLEQSSAAAHFLLLGAQVGSLSGLGKFREIAARERLLKAGVEQHSAEYSTLCAAAYPATQPAAFKGLPADRDETRRICGALAALVIALHDDDVALRESRGIAWRALQQQLAASAAPSGQMRVAGLAAPRAGDDAIGAALHLGPVTKVLDACVLRFPGAAQGPGQAG